LEVDERLCTLSIRDTAGEERFKSIAKNYFRHVDGTVLLYDVTCRNTFYEAFEWIYQFRSQTENIPLILCGNKIDLLTQQGDDYIYFVSKEEGMKMANSLGVLFMETSACDGTNVLTACEDLVRYGVLCPSLIRYDVHYLSVIRRYDEHYLSLIRYDVHYLSLIRRYDAVVDLDHVKA
jgi:small GTP-binding protein